MKQFLFSVCLVACMSATAQINHLLVEDGKVWTYHKENSTGVSTWEEVFCLEGDTAIAYRQCVKLYVTSNPPAAAPIDHLYKGALYEEDGKVFYIASGSTTPKLLYDFSCEPGAVVNIGPFELTVTKKWSVKYRSEYWTVIEWVPAEDDHFPCQWIEGVGLLIGVGNLTSLCEGIGTWWVGGFSYLKTCELNGQTIFDRDEYWKTSQTVTGIREMKSDGQQEKSIGAIYDLQGRRLPGKPTHGIYIEGRKKRVMK